MSSNENPASRNSWLISIGNRFADARNADQGESGCTTMLLAPDFGSHVVVCLTRCSCHFTATTGRNRGWHHRMHGAVECGASCRSIGERRRISAATSSACAITLLKPIGDERRPRRDRSLRVFRLQMRDVGVVIRNAGNPARCGRERAPCSRDATRVHGRAPASATYGISCAVADAVRRAASAARRPNAIIATTSTLNAAASAAST